MPTRVTIWVKRSSLVHERQPIPKKRRTNDLHGIHIKREIVNARGEVTIKTEEIDDGSTVCDHGVSESDLCEPSYDPHLSYKPRISSSTSKQMSSQVGGTSDNAAVCSFKSSVDTNLGSLSNQDSKSPPMNKVFSELLYEEELEYEEKVAQNFTAHGPAAMPFVLNKKEKRKYPSWDDSFKELVNFKAINGHTNVVMSSGPLGGWVNTQRHVFRRLKEEKCTPLINDRCEKLESIGFTFIRRSTRSTWDERFQELVDFKKINGHTNVPQRLGPLGSWVNNHRTQYRQYKEGKHSPLTNLKREKLESIGFEFICPPIGPHWDQRFQELLDFKKINGHTNVPIGSGPLGTWFHTQRTQCCLLEEGKRSTLTSDKCEKMERIGFEFKCQPTGQRWYQRFQELVDFKKINGHMNVPVRSGQLGAWVGNQRQTFCRLKEGEDSPLVIERRKTLESIGFEFKCPPTGPPWDQRFQELVDFKKINGHTNVPTNSGPLRRWVENQRRTFRQVEEGKRSPLAIERYEKLESIGFRFKRLFCRKS
eukprot:scaffold30781_cov52-Attheya_sp.AAC.1